MEFWEQCGEADYSPPQTQCWITALQGSSHSLARGAPAAFPRQFLKKGSNWSEYPKTSKNDTPHPPSPHGKSSSQGTRFSQRKGEDFIKLKVEGHSGAAAAATLERLARAGAAAASQLLFPRKEKPRGSGLLPIQVLAGAKRADTERELDHADSCQGVLFQLPQANTPMADCPSSSLLWLGVFSAGPWGWHGVGGAWSLPCIPGEPWRRLEEREYVPKVAMCGRENWG